jgi:hypothetical protein
LFKDQPAVEPIIDRAKSLKMTAAQHKNLSQTPSGLAQRM